MKAIFGSKNAKVIGTTTTPSKMKANGQGKISGTSTTYSVATNPTSVTTVTDSRSSATSLGDHSCGGNQTCPLPTSISVSRCGGNNKSTAVGVSKCDYGCPQISSTAVDLDALYDQYETNRVGRGKFCFPLEEDDEEYDGTRSGSSCDRSGVEETDKDCSCAAALVLKSDRAEMDDLSSATGTSESTMTEHDHLDASNQSVQKQRISALTKTIASMQSDIAIEFCSMIKRMAKMMEDAEKETTKSKLGTNTSSRVAICKELHQQAIQMASKQVRLSHQSTKFVVRLEQELADAKLACGELLMKKAPQQQDLFADKLHLEPAADVSDAIPPRWREKPRSTVDIPKRNLVDSDNVDNVILCEYTESTTSFCIKEITFCNSIVVDVNGVTEGEATSYFNKTSNVSETASSDDGEEDNAQLRFHL
jgi:hypothetical protein